MSTHKLALHKKAFQVSLLPLLFFKLSPPPMTMGTMMAAPANGNDDTAIGWLLVLLPTLCGIRTTRSNSRPHEGNKFLSQPAVSWNMDVSMPLLPLLQAS